MKEEKILTFVEFEEINNSNDDLLEWIDGQVYALASPSTAHQEVSLKLSVAFYPIFKDKNCKVFAAPFDVKLTKDNLDDQLVIPDLVVICDKSGLNEKRYEGVPTLIVKILSPSNRKHDLIIKMELYAKFGVKEYWIVDPTDKTIMVFNLHESGHYLVNSSKTEGIIQSTIFNDLSVDLDDLFNF